MNSVFANGERKRTTHIPGSRFSACCIAARMWRFNKVRVTALRACFLGTTKPNQRRSGGISSTGLTPETDCPVDNSSCEGPSGSCLPRWAVGDHTFGACAKWCTAKWVDRARQGALSTLVKSDALVTDAITGAASQVARGSALARASPDLRLRDACGPWRGVH